jgi:tetratricopeptide (TPR) repeat protein
MVAALLILVWLSMPAAAGTTFLMFPPENQSKVQGLAWIGEGLAIAISEELLVPGVETISWEERARFVESSDLPPNTPLSRASMIRVAQKAAVDQLVFGSCTGTRDNLRIALRVLDLKSLRLSGEIVANGPMSALPQLENELAWVILSDVGLNGALSREDFRARSRTVPNGPYSSFISCLAVSDEAERAKMLLKTVELYRDFPQASFFLGAYYFENGDCVRAIQYLKPAMKSAQSFLEAEFMLGTCYMKQDKLAEAVQAYNAVVKRCQALEVLNNLGVAYLRRGDYPLAAQNLVEARALAKTDLTVGLNLAILRYLQGDEPAAQAVLEEMVQVHADQGMLQYLYSLALESRGESRKAAVALDQAKKLGVDPEKAKRQDPRSWTQIFPVWARRPAVTWGGKVGPSSDCGQRH